MLAVWGLFWPRTASGPGGNASSDPFHPQCTCPEVGGPKSDHFNSNNWFLPPPTSRTESTHPPLKVDRMRHGPTKPKNYPKMVRFQSADLWSSALGVKRVRGSVSPWSRDRPKPKKAQHGHNSNICPRLQMGQKWVRLQRILMKLGGI